MGVDVALEVAARLEPDEVVERILRRALEAVEADRATLGRMEGGFECTILGSVDRTEDQAPVAARSRHVDHAGDMLPASPCQRGAGARRRGADHEEGEHRQSRGQAFTDSLPRGPPGLATRASGSHRIQLWSRVAATPESTPVIDGAIMVGDGGLER